MDLSTYRLRVLAGVAVAVLGAGATPAGAAPENLTCTACYLVDDTGTVLFDRAGDVALANASTTKMTTALAALERLAPDDRVTVSPRAAGTGGGGLDLEAGSVYTVETLLHALLMTSSNDAAVALAEATAGSEAAFVEAMERYAAGLGATDTSYATAHGLDMPGHASSAADLAVIARALLEVPLLADIVARAEASVPGPDGGILLENRNLLLETYRGATGVKTGFTADAGNVLVASAERHGRRLIAVVMHSVDATADATALLDHGWDRLRRTPLLRGGTAVGAVVLDGGSTVATAAGTVRGAYDPATVTHVFEPAATIRLPVAAGDVIGRVSVRAGDRTLSSVPAVAGSEVRAARRSAVADAVASLIAALAPVVGVGR
ncbi:MAG TPA: serine hydrolase [Actinomycetota bacterium]|nr:serine hydrolase [Actinomycetota bacterium]